MVVGQEINPFGVALAKDKTTRQHPPIMAEVIEYRDIYGSKIKVASLDGTKTYLSTKGHKNLKDARNTAINNSLRLLEFYAGDLSRIQRQRIESLFYNILEEINPDN